MSNIFNKKNKTENITFDDVSSLSHTKWNCKYHIVFTPKYRQKNFYGQKRMEIGKMLLYIYLNIIKTAHSIEMECAEIFKQTCGYSSAFSNWASSI